jgi:zinc protease
LPATAEPVTVADVAPVAGGEVVVAEREVPQSVILFGQAGLKREDPDFYAAYLVNHVLGGGGFGSRLTTEVREKRGLAYSIDTSLAALDHVGLVQGSAGTQNARAAETLDLIRGEWARMGTQGPTEKELADAKTYVIGSFALRFDSSLGIARLLVGLQLDGFGPDYLANRKGYFDSVTLADAKRVAKRLLDPTKLVVVVVGKPDGIAATRPAPSLD